MRIVRFILLFLLVTAPAVAQTSDAQWKSLADGNARYVAGHLKFDHIAEQRHHSAEHQNPPVTVLSCSDSRVPPELVFDRSLNSLFVIRVAGNVTGPDEVASIEYAIANGYTKMIVVLGHEECGAVRAALLPEDPATPSLVALVSKIRDSFESIDRNLHAATVRRAVEANARAAAKDLIAQSTVIAEAVKAGKVAMVVAYYDLDTGKV